MPRTSARPPSGKAISRACAAWAAVPASRSSRPGIAGRTRTATPETAWLRSGDPALGRGFGGHARVTHDDVAENVVDPLHDRWLEPDAGGLDVLVHLLR